MASPPETIGTVLVVGNALMINKHFLAGVNAIWFYDYILTLPDEIACAWPRRNSPIFVLFVLNRYWPLLYLIWVSVASWGTEYTKSMCDKTAWLPVFYFAFATLFSQIVITLRVYVVTGKNRRICTFLFFMVSAQFIFGMYLAIRFSLEPSLELPDLPFDEFRICASSRWRPGEITGTTFSIVYDTLAFLIILYSVKWRGTTHGVSSILNKIFRDATTYFIVIFTSHLLQVLFESFAPQTIQLLPASANAVLVPLMTARLMLSLRKFASPPDTVWSFDDAHRPESLRFANYTIGGSERGDGGGVALKSLSPKRRNSLSEP